MIVRKLIPFNLALKIFLYQNLFKKHPFNNTSIKGVIPLHIFIWLFFSQHGPTDSLGHESTARSELSLAYQDQWTLIRRLRFQSQFQKDTT